MAEEQTAGGRTLTLILALNYSSRSEITHAVQQIAQRVEAGQIAPSEISEETISTALYTAPYPNPDLIVRTSGEQRLSNFLLWQASYAELCVPRSAVARLHGGGVRPRDGGIRTARSPLRTG